MRISLKALAKWVIADKKVKGSISCKFIKSSYEDIDDEGIYGCQRDGVGKVVGQEILQMAMEWDKDIILCIRRPCQDVMDLEQEFSVTQWCEIRHALRDGHWWPEDGNSTWVHSDTYHSDVYTYSHYTFHDTISMAHTNHEKRCQWKQLTIMIYWSTWAFHKVWEIHIYDNIWDMNAVFSIARTSTAVPWAFERTSEMVATGTVPKVTCWWSCYAS